MDEQGSPPSFWTPRGKKNARRTARRILLLSRSFFQKIFKKSLPHLGFGESPQMRRFFSFRVTRTRIRPTEVAQSSTTPGATVTFFAWGKLDNVPAQVARAQEGSLLRRLECLSCPCSG